MWDCLDPFPRQACELGPQHPQHVSSLTPLLALSSVVTVGAGSGHLFSSKNYSTKTCFFPPCAGFRGSWKCLFASAGKWGSLCFSAASTRLWGLHPSSWEWHGEFLGHGGMCWSDPRIQRWIYHVKVESYWFFCRQQAGYCHHREGSWASVGRDSGTLGPSCTRSPADVSTLVKRGYRTGPGALAVSSAVLPKPPLQETASQGMQNHLVLSVSSSAFLPPHCHFGFTLVGALVTLSLQKTGVLSHAKQISLSWIRPHDFWKSPDHLYLSLCFCRLFSISPPWAQVARAALKCHLAFLAAVGQTHQDFLWKCV